MTIAILLRVGYFDGIGSLVWLHDSELLFRLIFILGCVVKLCLRSIFVPAILLKVVVYVF
jgi:hypothetical protein